MAKKKTSDNPLTLAELVHYNHEVLFPALEERFVTKDEFQDFKKEMHEFKGEMYDFKKEMSDFKSEMSDFKREMYGFREEMYDFKKEMYEFKEEMQKFRDDSLTNQDIIIKKLDILLEEKKIADYQYEKQKKLLFIVIKTLRDNKLLSDKDMSVIKNLEVF